jgi:DNA repair protein RecN (Recombination protein N)
VTWIHNKPELRAMLCQLDIRNFAIIDDLSLELQSGLSALTGETGAGKSILLDALGLLLGDRAESDSIRAGADKAEISASFLVTDASDARQWLQARELEDSDSPDNCLIRRVVARDGRGRAFINGSVVSTRDLRELGEHLVDIHGQHEHQSLTKRETQRELLDGYAGHAALCEKVAGLAREWQQLDARIAEIEQKGSDGGARIDFIRFQVQELDALNLQPDELERLDAEHKRLSNAGRLIDQGQQVLQMLYEGERAATYDQLGQAHHLLTELASLEPRYGEAAELVASAQIQVQEATDTLRRTLDGLDLDPKRLQQLEQRLADIHNLARKHRLPPAELASHLENLRLELQQLEGASVELDKLAAEREALGKAWRVQAEALSQARGKCAKKLSAAITEVMRTLGMSQGEFKIALEQTKDDLRPRPQGLDQIEFMVSANPGQEVRPLAKVASGGELSRMSLAVQVIAAHATRVPTLIFDEVDAGIGGGVAEIVGRQLRTLGVHRQVLCVTHLPQVAAQAQQQLQVRKEVKSGQTFTRIRPLADKDRVEELARMLGGVDITAQTRAHAKDMLTRATG